MRFALLSVFIYCAIALTPYGDNGDETTIMPCNNSKQQQWDIQTDSYHHFVLKATGECLDVNNYSEDDQSKVQVWQCHPDDKDPTHQNQGWQVNTNGTITEISSGKCLDRSNYGTTPGTQVWLYHCTGAANQQWVVNGDGTIRAKDSGLCLNAGPTPLPPRPCDVEPGKSMLFCDITKPRADRIQNLVSNLTTDEKIGLFGTTHANPVPRLNIPIYEWWSEALHGVGGSPGVSFGGDAPCATSFPQVINTGATWNRTLMGAIGATISTEARAMNNVQRAGLTFWAPNVNIFRDPRWGRGQETPGEDPYLTAEYATQFVSNMQNDSTYLKVSSCCKHFTAYDLENWGGVDRHHFNAKVSDQDLADTFNVPFQACVERGKASALMCSYNEVNGIPSCANGALLSLARETWGFEGYITSDCDAVDDVYNTHKYVNTPADAVTAVLQAGMDIDCTGTFTRANLQGALDSGKLSMDTVDLRLRELFAVQFRLGMFDPLSLQPYTLLTPKDSLATPAHQQLAYEAAVQSIILLKNDRNTLPFVAGRIKTVAVVGPNGNATGTMQGNYQGTACYLHSPVDGLKTFANPTFAEGCTISGSDTSNIPAAVALASQADATVVVVGIDQSIESEGKDRTDISLPGVQNQLITAVCGAARGPCVVVYMVGGAVDMTPAKTNPKVGAIVWAGYPGQSGGDALASVLFGAYNPGGRLPYTVYQTDYIANLSMFDMSMRPNPPSNPGRSYRFYNGSVVFPFGYGLSYTNFSYSVSFVETSVTCSRSQARTERVTDIVITVKNTGTIDGNDVVIAFMVPPNPGQQGQPLKYVVGFERVFLKSGQSVTLKFPVSVADLSLYDVNGQPQLTAGIWQALASAPSSTADPSVASLCVHL